MQTNVIKKILTEEKGVFAVLIAIMASVLLFILIALAIDTGLVKSGRSRMDADLDLIARKVMYYSPSTYSVAKRFNELTKTELFKVSTGRVTQVRLIGEVSDAALNNQNNYFSKIPGIEGLLQPYTNFLPFLAFSTSQLPGRGSWGEEFPKNEIAYFIPTINRDDPLFSTHVKQNYPTEFWDSRQQFNVRFSLEANGVVNTFLLGEKPVQSKVTYEISPKNVTSRSMIIGMDAHGVTDYLDGVANRNAPTLNELQSPPGRFTFSQTTNSGYDWVNSPRGMFSFNNQYYVAGLSTGEPFFAFDDRQAESYVSGLGNTENWCNYGIPIGNPVTTTCTNPPPYNTPANINFNYQLANGASYLPTTLVPGYAPSVSALGYERAQVVRAQRVLACRNLISSVRNIVASGLVERAARTPYFQDSTEFVVLRSVPSAQPMPPLAFLPLRVAAAGQRPNMLARDPSRYSLYPTNNGNQFISDEITLNYNPSFAEVNPGTPATYPPGLLGSAFGNASDAESQNQWVYRRQIRDCYHLIMQPSVGPLLPPKDLGFDNKGFEGQGLDTWQDSPISYTAGDPWEQDPNIPLSTRALSVTEAITLIPMIQKSPDGVVNWGKESSLGAEYVPRVTGDVIGFLKYINDCTTPLAATQLAPAPDGDCSTVPGVAPDLFTNSTVFYIMHDLPSLTVLGAGTAAQQAALAQFTTAITNEINIFTTNPNRTLVVIYMPFTNPALANCNAVKNIFTNNNTLPNVRFYVLSAGGETCPLAAPNLTPQDFGKYFNDLLSGPVEKNIYSKISALWSEDIMRIRQVL